MQRGKFIVLEGGDGAGKSTVVSFLRAELSETEFLTTRAGGSTFGEKIRALFVSDDAGTATPESRFSLAFAAQAEHIHKTVAPALESGTHVISDRLDASIFAYQVYAEEKTKLVQLFWDTRKVLMSKALPDMYIYLDISPEEGAKRIQEKGKKFDHFEKRSIDFHERVRVGYREFFKTVPHLIVDANRPLPEVEEEVLGYIKNLIAKK